MHATFIWSQIVQKIIKNSKLDPYSHLNILGPSNNYLREGEAIEEIKKTQSWFEKQAMGGGIP